MLDTPFRCFTRVGCGLTHKHLTTLEKLARDKHTSLLRKSVNYRHKKFYNIGTWSDVAVHRVPCLLAAVGDVASAELVAAVSQPLPEIHVAGSAVAAAADGGDGGGGGGAVAGGNGGLNRAGAEPAGGWSRPD